MEGIVTVDKKKDAMTPSTFISVINNTTPSKELHDDTVALDNNDQYSESLLPSSFNDDVNTSRITERK